MDLGGLIGSEVTLVPLSSNVFFSCRDAMQPAGVEFRNKHQDPAALETHFFTRGYDHQNTITAHENSLKISYQNYFYYLVNLLTLATK